MPSSGARAAPADRVVVKASSSGGAAASASGGAGGKSVLGLREKMERLRAARPKVSHSLNLSIDSEVCQHVTLCPATNVVQP